MTATTLNTAMLAGAWAKHLAPATPRHACDRGVEASDTSVQPRADTLISTSVQT
jgi:hypothetical protein